MPYEYQGGGYIPNVPARDLTDEEARRYGVERSALYRRVRAKRAQPAEAPAEAAVEAAGEEDGDA